MTVFEYLKLPANARPRLDVILHHSRAGCDFYAVKIGPVDVLEWRHRAYNGKVEREPRIFGDRTSAELTVRDMMKGIAA